MLSAMIFDHISLDDNMVYDCFLEKAKRKSLPLVWCLKGKAIVVSGGDPYDEIIDVASGDSPEELLVWAQLNGLSLSDDPRKQAEDCKCYEKKQRRMVASK